MTKFNPGKLVTSLAAAALLSTGAIRVSADEHPIKLGAI
jgi:hypothetical protein